MNEMVIDNSDVKVEAIPQKNQEEEGHDHILTPEEKENEKRKQDTYKDEMKLSLSEIISKRYKNKIQVHSATNP